jgi:gliding motility-associated lipoprotein GldH
MFSPKKMIWCGIVALTIFATSCNNTIGVYEKNVEIPNFAWDSSYKPQFSFEITDTISLYNIYVVVRHTDAYRYNNIWMNVYTMVPRDTLNKQRLDLRLATDDKGWLGTGMDDIFEHRILITSAPQKLSKSGIYTFRLENIMREDPLPHVMNVGIRVEKAKG